MESLLARIADAERQRRHVAAATGLAVAAGWGTYFGLAAGERSLTSDEKSTAVVIAIGVPVAFVAGGIYALARESDGERLLRRVRAAVAEPGADLSRIVAETEASLRKILEDERKDREWGLITGWVGTGLAVTGLLLNETGNETSHDYKLITRGALAASCAIGLAQVLSLHFSSSATEKLIDLWQKDPDWAHMPSLSVAPLPGGGMVALSGRF